MRLPQITNQVCGNQIDIERLDGLGVIANEMRSISVLPGGRFRLKTDLRIYGCLSSHLRHARLMQTSEACLMGKSWRFYLWMCELSARACTSKWLSQYALRPCRSCQRLDAPYAKKNSAPQRSYCCT